MQLSAICDRLDDRLRTAAYADLDASANGLQVGPDSATVDHAAFAVDAAVQTIDDAIRAGADLLITHHGLVWDGLDRLAGTAYRRIAPLVRHGVALYVSHLPLDGHPELGNAAGVADALGLIDREPFGSIGEETIGRRGQVDGEPYSPERLRDALESELGPVRPVNVLEFGPETITDVAVLTGSGADWVDEAAEAGVDAFVTGEGKQALYHAAREAGLHVFLAGHYATETFGVRSLQGLATDWGLETTFIDAPTGL